MLFTHAQQENKLQLLYQNLFHVQHEIQHAFCCGQLFTFHPTKNAGINFDPKKISRIKRHN